MQPDYNLVQQLLNDTAPSLSPAVVHGALTGYISSGARVQTDLFEDLLETPLPSVVQDLISRLDEATRSQLDADFQFQPLLPDDESALQVRLRALSQWCDWFNIGFAAGFMRPQTDMSAELVEVLSDFGQVAGADAFEGEASVQDEANYMELLEYVRMATVTVYQQMQQ